MKPAPWRPPTYKPVSERRTIKDWMQRRGTTALPQARADEVDDGRALEWLAVASQASKPGIAPSEHLFRTAFLMLVRFHSTGVSHGFVHDVMTCAAVACETPWASDKDSVFASFCAFYDRVTALRDARKRRSSCTDETFAMTERSRKRRFKKKLLPRVKGRT